MRFDGTQDVNCNLSAHLLLLQTVDKLVECRTRLRDLKTQYAVQANSSHVADGTCPSGISPGLPRILSLSSLFLIMNDVTQVRA